MTLEILDLGTTKCSCGCGEEASQIYRGIPIPLINPITHYKRYQERIKMVREEARKRLDLRTSPLEHFTPEGFEQARRGI